MPSRGDGCQALVAGHVGGVDEAAQRACDLAGPDGVRVGLGGVFKIAEQVLGAQLVADAVEGVVVQAYRSCTTTVPCRSL